MLKVCTWNSRGTITPDTSAPFAATARDRGAFIRAMRPDALALQECEATLSLGLQSQTRVATRNPRKSVAIASQHQIDNLVEIPGGNAIGAKICAPTPFYFASIWSFGTRQSGDGFYLDLIACADDMVRFFHAKSVDLGLPLIVAGDFNASYSHPLSRKNAAYRQNVFEGWHGLGLRSAYHTFFDVAYGEEREPTVMGRSGRSLWQFHIDYVFFDSARLGVNLARLQHNMGSDHFPVCADLAWR